MLKSDCITTKVDVLYNYNPPQPERPVICLGIGNGFPAEMYTPLMEAIQTEANKVCLPPRPWWDGTDPAAFRSWHQLADDLVAGIREHDLAPVIGVGHSMSGVAMMYAAAAHPDLFKGIVLLDPVFFPRPALWAIRLARLANIELNKKMINGALNRRQQWDSLDAAYQHFRKRSLFSRCSDDVVRLYVEGMTHLTEKGVELAYPPAWEARIFATPPLDEWDYLPTIQIPCTIIAGVESNAFSEVVRRRWQRVRPDIPLHVLADAGHLVPVEQPEQVARRIDEFMAALQNK
jgi:pimeloyl-ACP methyl ester carboxylesterase